MPPRLPRKGRKRRPRQEEESKTPPPPPPPPSPALQFPPPPQLVRSRYIHPNTAHDLSLLDQHGGSVELYTVLSLFTVKHLLEFAKENGLTRLSGLRKNELIDIIMSIFD